MALGDITPYEAVDGGSLASRSHQVKANASYPIINAGEPVSKTLGNQYVLAGVNATPLVNQAITSAWAGIAATTSNETTSVDGTVQVIPLGFGSQMWLNTPLSTSTYGVGSTPNQTTYNALVGARVCMQLTSGTYNILATDNNKNGLVVENLDVIRYPGKVAFSVVPGASYLGIGYLS